MCSPGRGETIYELVKSAQLDNDQDEEDQMNCMVYRKCRMARLPTPDIATPDRQPEPGK